MKAKTLVMLTAIAGLAVIMTLGGCKKKADVPAAGQAVAQTTDQAKTCPPDCTKPCCAPKDKACDANTAKPCCTVQPADATVAAAAADAPAAVKEVVEQTTCPVMGGKINKDIFTEYKGKKVYFCCPACVEEFKKDPEKYLSKLPQFQN